MESERNILEEADCLLTSLKTPLDKSLEDMQNVCCSLKNLRVMMKNYKNQETLREKFQEQNLHFFQDLANILKHCTDPELNRNIVNFGLQLGINCMVSNDKNKAFLFENLISTEKDELKILLDFILQDAKLTKFLAMIMNSVVAGFEKEKAIDSWKILQFRMILHRLLAYFFHEDYSGKDINQNNDESFEWFYYLIANVFNISNYLVYFQTEKSIIKIIWKIIDHFESDPYENWDPTSQIEKHIENKSKLQLLYFLHNAFEKTIAEKSQTSLIINYNSKNETLHELYDKKKEHGISITTPDFLFIIELFNGLSEDIIQRVRNLRENQFNNLNEIKPKLNQSLDYFHGILKIFCQVTFLGGYNKLIQEKFFDNGSFASALKALQEIYQLDRALEKDGGNPLKITDILHEDGYFELYLNFLRLASNIVHINPKAQDYVYDNDYLLLLLSFTVVDKNNPYIREWSIVLIRNLTENNPRIQEKIAQLKVVDFDSKTKELLKKFAYQPDGSLLE